MSLLSTLLLYGINRRWLLFGLIIAIGFSLMTPPEGLDTQGWRSIGLTIAAMIWFLKRAVRPAAIALLIIVLHVLLGVSVNEEVARSFFNESVFFIMGLLMLGTAIIKQRLDRSMGKMLYAISHGNYEKFIMALGFSSAVITAMLGEYVASTLFLPFLLTILASHEDIETRRTVAKPLLIVVAYGCILGGIAAPSGGARNVVLIQYLHEHHKIHINYFQWVQHTLPVMIIGMVFLFIFIKLTFRLPGINKPIPDLTQFKEEWSKPLTPQDKTALLIIGITLFLWLGFSQRLGMGIIAVFGAALFLILGLVKWEDYNKNVNWGVVILYSAVVMLGASLYEKGAINWLSSKIISMFSDPYYLYHLFPVAIIIITIIIANFMGAIGAVALFSPLFLKIGSDIGIDSETLAYLIAAASSFAFLSYRASPASTMIFTTGYVSSKMFLKIGWKVLVLSIFALVIVAKLYWQVI